MKILPEAAKKRKTWLKQDGRAGKPVFSFLIETYRLAKIYGFFVRNPDTEKFLYLR